MSILLTYISVCYQAFCHLHKFAHRNACSWFLDSVSLRAWKSTHIDHLPCVYIARIASPMLVVSVRIIHSHANALRCSCSVRSYAHTHRSHQSVSQRAPAPPHFHPYTAHTVHCKETSLMFITRNIFNIRRKESFLISIARIHF